MTVRLCGKGLHALEGDNLLPIKGRGHTGRCRACKQGNEERYRPTMFEARWPILDPDLTRDELIAEATADLPNVRPPGRALHSKVWTVDGSELVLRARAARPSLPGETCKNGHDLSHEDNVVMYADGRRRCRECRDESQRGVREARHAVAPLKLRPRENERRFPVAPLLDLLERGQYPGVGEDDMQALHRALRNDGRLPEVYADRIACRMKLHPCLIWPEWFAEEVAA